MSRTDDATAPPAPPPTDADLAADMTADGESPGEAGAAAAALPVLRPLCPACRAPTQPEDRFCRRCGEHVRAPEVPDDAGLSARVFPCGSCGAEVEVEEGLVTARCAFCGTPYVAATEGTTVARERPDAVLPFRVDLERARAAFRSWKKGKWLRRRALKTAGLKHITGVYVPVRLFTAEARSHWSADIGEQWTETYTETYTDSQGRTRTRTRTRTHTEWYPHEGGHLCLCGPVPVSGSRGLPQEWLDRLRPFDPDRRTSYRDEYLAGWRAEACGVEYGPAWSTARQRMRERVRQRIDAFVPGDTHRNLVVNPDFENVEAELVYVPVWTAAFQVGDRTCRFLVNGRTGEPVGEAPWSWLKITLLAVGVVGAVVGALWLGGVF